MGVPKCVYIGTAGRRLALFQEALRSRNLGEPVLVTYADLLRGESTLSDLIEAGDLVRLDSPGRDFELERMFLRIGWDTCDARGYAGERKGFLNPSEIEALVFDRGIILPQRQWYYGWREALGRVERELTDCAPHRLMNSPSQIAVLFDKVRCHEVLVGAGINVPFGLGTVQSFEELVARMNHHAMRRVFLKPAHGSSASGLVAFECSGGRYSATTTVETVLGNGTVKLYNSRRIRKHTDLNEIRALVDRLSVHNLFVQSWYPKAGLGAKRFDLRVLVVGGKSRHVVVRESHSPFTNLHLLNGRGQLSLVRKRLGDERFHAVLRSCEGAAKLFPECLYVGVDVLISSDFRNHAVAELNAFGDQLPGVLYRGCTTYECELDNLLQSHSDWDAATEWPQSVVAQMVPASWMNAVPSADGNAVSSTDGNAVSSADGNAVSSADGNAVSSVDGNAVSSADGNVVSTSEITLV